MKIFTKTRCHRLSRIAGVAMLFLLPLPLGADPGMEAELLKSENEHKEAQAKYGRILEQCSRAVAKNWRENGGQAEDGKKAVEAFKKHQGAWYRWMKNEARFRAGDENDRYFSGFVTANETELLNERMNRLKKQYLQEPGAAAEGRAKEYFPDGTENYSRSLGNLPLKAKPGFYRVYFQHNRGVFVIQWLKDRMVRGYYYPEDDVEEIRFYGHNKKDGEIYLQAFGKLGYIGDGTLTKSHAEDEEGGVIWRGTISGTDERGNYAEAGVTLEKIDSVPPRTNTKAVAYRGLAEGNKGFLYEIQWHKNGVVTGSLDFSGGHGEGESSYLHGVNYQEGKLVLLGGLNVDGQWGPARCCYVLSKVKVRGAIVWQGYKYGQEGGIYPVAFGRVRK